MRDPRARALRARGAPTSIRDHHDLYSDRDRTLHRRLDCMVYNGAHHLRFGSELTRACHCTHDLRLDSWGSVLDLLSVATVLAAHDDLAHHQRSLGPRRPLTTMGKVLHLQDRVAVAAGLVRFLTRVPTHSSPDLLTLAQGACAEAEALLEVTTATLSARSSQVLRALGASGPLVLTEVSAGDLALVNPKITTPRAALALKAFTLANRPHSALLLAPRSTLECLVDPSMRWGSGTAVRDLYRVQVLGADPGPAAAEVLTTLYRDDATTPVTELLALARALA